MEPQGVAIALSLHQDHVTGTVCLFQEPEPVREWLVPASPPELLCAVQGCAEADRNLLTFLVRIGDADGGLVQIGYLPQAQATQVVYWQLLLFRVALQRAAVS